MVICDRHSLLLTHSGELYGHGENRSGQLGLGTNDDQNTWIKLSARTDIKAISAGFHHSLFLTEAGELHGCGFLQGYGGQENQNIWVRLRDNTKFRVILANYLNSFFISESGELYGCGINNYYELGTKTKYKNKFWAHANENMSPCIERFRRQRFFAFIPASLKIVFHHCKELYLQLLSENNTHVQMEQFSKKKLDIKKQLIESLPVPWDQEFEQLNLDGFVEFFNRLRHYFKLESVDELQTSLKQNQ